MIKLFRNWIEDITATALAEFSLIFPILMTMLLGVFELGNGIMVNQKAIAASQIVADLIARESSISDDEFDEAIRAGELAIMPFDTDPLGFDVISVRFDEDDEPEEVWRETRNMTAGDGLLERATGLGTEGDGALIVLVEYNYDPFFGGMILDGGINMQEVAFSRGRRTAVIARE